MEDSKIKIIDRFSKRSRIEIKIIDKVSKRNCKGFFETVGRITINDWYETFDMSLAWWKPHTYERQWQAGLKRIKDHNMSCLVTRIQNPRKGPYIDWWLLYKEDNTIFIRNNVLFREWYEEQIGNNLFTVENCYDFIPPFIKYEVLEGGQLPATWRVDISNSAWFNGL